LKEKAVRREHLEVTQLEKIESTDIRKELGALSVS
jgi:hypothetical protein